MSNSQAFCKTGYELITEVANIPAESIPVFNDDAFRNVIDEVHVQHDQLTSVFSDALERYNTSAASAAGRADDEGAPTTANSSLMWRGSEAEATEVMVYHTAILRNKRLLMAYVKKRIDILRELRWTHGVLPEHVKSNLTPQELQFFKEYSKLLSKYMRSSSLGGVGLDLTADPEPPIDPYIQVRVMRDYGEVTFSSGSVHLRPGLSLWLLRDEAHSLLIEGVLRPVT
jgi:GINS complex subunit 1